MVDDKAHCSEEAKVLAEVYRRFERLEKNSENLKNMITIEHMLYFLGFGVIVHVLMKSMNF